MTQKFFVTGGVYRDFDFLFVDGDKETYGPFPSYAEAFDCWKAKVWLHVDNALHRLVIDKRDIALPCGIKN